jgi:hypothetical protein
MNADIPYLPVWVRRKFVAKGGGMEKGYAFAISSFTGRALAFHVMLQSGAHYRHVPLHALSTRPISKDRPITDLQLWDCFTYRPVVTTFAYLLDHPCVCYLPKEEVPGKYLFTVDWLPDPHPGWVLQPDQNKCAHVLALADGNIAALPTNRIVWRDGFFVGLSGSARRGGYITQSQTYHAEGGWDFSQDDSYFYRPQEGRTGAMAAGATPARSEG